MTLQWFRRGSAWGLRTEDGIPVATVDYSRGLAGYVDGKGILLAKTFQGAREAVERRLEAKGRKA